jgi:hypothetical protein
MVDQPIPPIVCDMTDAPDTAPERIASYHELFSSSLVGRERTGDGIRFRFRAEPGLEDRVRDLAAREEACCAFFSFAVTTRDTEVWWDTSVVDDDVARQILDEFYRLPETMNESVAALHHRFADRGLQIVVNEDGTQRLATLTAGGSGPTASSVAART